MLMIGDSGQISSWGQCRKSARLLKTSTRSTTVKVTIGVNTMDDAKRMCFVWGCKVNEGMLTRVDVQAR